MLPINTIVKNKLNNFSYNNIQSDWNEFEKKLPNKKPSIIKYITISSIAAVLVASLTYIFNNDTKTNETKIQTTELSNKIENTIETKITENTKATNTQKESIKKATEPTQNKTEKKLEKPENKKNNNNKITNNNITKEETINNNKKEVTPNNENIIAEKNENIKTDNYNPISTFTVSNNEGCIPFSTNFQAKENHKDVSYTWEFSDGFTSNKKTIKHIFKKAGDYTIKLITEYKDKKSISTQKITTHKKPDATFTYKQENNTYYFDGPDNNKLEWNFGDNTKTSEIDPEHIFKLIGSTNVELTVENEYGCKSSKKEKIKIEPIFKIANAFSPDNNGFNDAFGPIFEYPENYDFELYIYNMQGKLYFKSLFANQNWNGKINNTDQLAEKGYYLWKLIITDKYNNKIIKNGNLTIK